MKKQAGVFTLATVALATAMGGAVLLKKKSAHHEPPPLPTSVVVDVRQLSSGTASLTVHAIADIEPVREVLINSRMMGFVTSLPLSEGSQFRRGQLLVKIDPGAQGSSPQVSALDAELAAARANLNVEQERLRRTRSLYAIQGASLEQVQAAEAASAMATSRVTTARENLGSAVVLAPFDGVVSQRLAQAGDSVSPGKLLMKINDSSLGTRILVNVPSNLTPALVRIGGQSLPLQPWPEAGAGGTRRYEARSTQKDLIPGSHMPVELEIYRADTGVLVPHECMLNDDGHRATVLALRVTHPAAPPSTHEPAPPPTGQRIEPIHVLLVAQSEEGAIVTGAGIVGRTVACGSPDVLARLQAGMPFQAMPSGG
jgi:RND family efflux transporter MFP subunit